MSETIHILVVDDEPNIRYVLQKTLEKEGYTVDAACNGAEAINKIEHQTYDLAMLDLMMEPIGGLQVLSVLKKRDPEAVVIILTAHSTLDSAIEALRLGAFDYLYKPSSPEKIRQRVAEGLKVRQKNLYRAKMLKKIEDFRRSMDEIQTDPETTPDAKPSRLLISGPLQIDRVARSATLGDKTLDLTTTEYNFLLCLMETSPHPVSARHLVSYSLGYDSGEAEAREICKWHIHRLRQKIEANPDNPCFIKTIRYKGYLWSSED